MRTNVPVLAAALTLMSTTILASPMLGAPPKASPMTAPYVNPRTGSDYIHRGATYERPTHRTVFPGTPSIHENRQVHNADYGSSGSGGGDASSSTAASSTSAVSPSSTKQPKRGFVWGSRIVLREGTVEIGDGERGTAAGDSQGSARRHVHVGEGSYDRMISREDGRRAGVNQVGEKLANRMKEDSSDDDGSYDEMVSRDGELGMGNGPEGLQGGGAESFVRRNASGGEGEGSDGSEEMEQQGEGSDNSFRGSSEEIRVKGPDGSDEDATRRDVLDELEDAGEGYYFC